MFTGIIMDVGRVRSVVAGGDTRIEIETALEMGTIALGASIACSGPCLTVIERGPNWFAVTASAETLSRTTLGGWHAGTPVNLERALRLGDELGGHLVTGHIDGIATLREDRPEGDSRRWLVEAPTELAQFIAAKGSVALDGVSLTVNEVNGTRFGVNLIPHTLTHTTFGSLRAGAGLNLEIDLLARYLQRLVDSRGKAVELPRDRFSA
ncbi:MAG TPA: riboflavin synthase [Methylomirabilota bacterium]|jgi:riboflavin synthase|nr:riboflavin synthase [Methylomirabilota bacterium]